MSSNEPVKNGCEVIYEMFHYIGFYTHYCLNCVRNCEDHSSLDFKSAVQCMKHFIYHFTIIIIVITGKDLSKELGFRMPVHLLCKQVNREEFFLLFNVKIIGQVYELAPSKNIAIIS